MIAGIVLVGGEGRRIGGGKPFVALGGRPLLAHVVERVAPQLSRLALSVRAPDPRYASFGLPLIVDRPNVEGPLAGLLAGLDWAAAEGAGWLLTVPTDTPFLPANLVARLVAAAAGAETEAVVAASAGAPHPTVGLFRPALAPRLERHLASTPRRSIAAFLDTLATATADFPTDPLDPFLNVNTSDDLVRAARLLPP